MDRRYRLNDGKTKWRPKAFPGKCLWQDLEASLADSANVNMDKAAFIESRSFSVGGGVFLPRIYNMDMVDCGQEGRLVFVGSA
jgi:hypothetical protein